LANVQHVPAGTDMPLVGAYYFPMSQAPRRRLVLAARSGTDERAEALVPGIRRALAAIDPELPLFDAALMQTRVDASLVPRRLPMLLAVAFASVALFLSGIGIYGVLAFGVAERPREIGIRLALGSTGLEVFGLVLVDGVRIVVAGLVVGLAGAYGVGRVMAEMLYGVAPMDASWPA
jgi:hypothetical protein